MPCRPDPRPAFTPAQCDWLVAQFFHALPALESELKKLNHWRNKVNAMLDEKRLNVEQRAELTYILDQLAKRGLIYTGTEDGPTRDGDGRFIGGEQ